MREIKYRQAIFSKGIFHHWHYWGFMEQYGHMTFAGPETHLSSPEGAYKNSYQYIGLLDINRVEIYEGDIVCADAYYWEYNFHKRKSKSISESQKVIWKVLFSKGNFCLNPTDDSELNFLNIILIQLYASTLYNDAKKAGIDEKIAAEGIKTVLNPIIAGQYHIAKQRVYLNEINTIDGKLFNSGKTPEKLDEEYSAFYHEKYQDETEMSVKYSKFEVIGNIVENPELKED